MLNTRKRKQASDEGVADVEVLLPIAYCICSSVQCAVQLIVGASLRCTAPNSTTQLRQRLRTEVVDGTYLDNLATITTFSSDNAIMHDAWP